MLGFDLTAAGFFAPKSKYSISDIPDLTGKVVIVTGANTGIGKVTARVLLSKNAKVYAACRSQEKAEEAIKELKELTGKDDIHYLKLDLGNIKQSHEAAESFLKLETRLDLLINSAGVMTPPPNSLTSDNLDLQFGTNVIGHYAFSVPLFPLLIKTAESSPPGSVRVIWVSSSGHYLLTPKGGVDLESIKDPKRLNVNQLYGQSKLGDIQLANVAADKLSPHGVISVSLHPGNINTDLTRHSPAFLKWLAGKLLAHPDDGAITQLYAATSPEITIADSKAYFVPYARKYQPSHPAATDEAACLKTWEYCEKIVEEVLSN